MAQFYKVEKGLGLKWPSKCAVCGSSEVVPAKAHGVTVDDIRWYFFFFRISTSSLFLSYPLCKRHRSIWRAIRVLTYALLGGVGPIIIVLLIYVPTHASTIWGVTGIAIAALWFLATRLPPVRISKVRDNYFMLRIKNDRYALEMEQLNADKLGTW